MFGQFSFLIVLAIFSSISTNDCAKVVCYFASWARYRHGLGEYTIDDIPVEECSHVIYAFVGVDDTTWSIKPLDPHNDLVESGFMNFTGRKADNPKAMFMVGLGGWAEGGEKYSALVSNQSRRTSFINNTLEFLEKYRFDGIDISWEYPGAENRGGRPSDYTNFYLFVSELKSAMKMDKPHLELTISAPFKKELMKGYAVRKLCREVDAVHVMSYDLRRTKFGFVDVHSPLYGLESDYETNNTSIDDDDGSHGLKLWASLGCPSEKILLGIPFYGRTFTLLNANNHSINDPIKLKSKGGNPGKYTRKRGLLAYYEVCQYEDEANWKREFDKSGMCPYLYYGDQWIGYEDVFSLYHKIDYITLNDYGGAMVWSIDMDDFHGICGPKNNLLKILRSELENYQPSPSNKNPKWPKMFPHAPKMYQEESQDEGE